jgi:hypothetical protein
MRFAQVSASNKQRMITVFIWLIGLWIAWTVGHWVVDEQTRFLIFAAIGFVLCAIALIILHSWRTGFYLFLVWLLFEDLIRKYLGNNMAIFFAKDCLAGLSYISLLMAIRRKEARSLRAPFLVFLSLFFWLAVLQVFNPNSPSAFYGFLGIKVDFFYVPLAFLGYALIRDERDLQPFFLTLMFLAIVISGLGIIQGIVGPQFLNPATLQHDIQELAALQKVTPLTNQVFFLPSSVFVSNGRFSLYLILAIIVGLGSVGYFVLATLRGRMVLYIGMAVVAIGVMLSGSRAALLFTLISAFALGAAFLWGAPWRLGRGRRLVKAIRRSLIFASLGIAGFILMFPSAAATRLGFYSETLFPSSSAYQLSQRSWSYPMHELGKALSGPHWVMGNGTGTASLGAQYVSEFLKEPMPEVAVEEGFGQLIAEMGILAPLLWILWTTAVVVTCWKIARSLKGTRFFPVGAAIAWYAFLLLFALSYLGLDAYQNYVNNAFLWILIGILFRLPELAAQSPALAAPGARSLL